MIFYNVVEFLGIFQYHSCLINNTLTNVGWNQWLFTAVENDDFKVFFQFFNLHRKRGLCNKTGFGGLSKMPVSVYRNNIFQLG